MSKHLKHTGRDVGKRGMNVDVKYMGTDSPEARIKAMDSAIKTLKRRMVQEGVVRDMRRKEFFETGSEKRRKALKEAIRRAAKAKKEF